MNLVEDEKIEDLACFLWKPIDPKIPFEDRADEYAIVRNDKATAGLIVYSKYHDGWIANCNNRHLIRELMKRCGLWKEVESED